MAIRIARKTILVIKNFSIFVCSATAIIMFVAVAANSIIRYVFGSALEWAPETARYAMIYGVAFGVLWAYAAGQHPDIGVLPKAKRWVSVLIDVCAGVFGIALAASAWIYVSSAGMIFANYLPIQMGYFYAALLVGGILLVVLVLARLFLTLAGENQEEEANS